MRNLEWLVLSFWFLLMAALLTGCPSSRDRIMGDIQADIWVNDRLPSRLCQSVPELWNFGVARRVDCSHPSAERSLCGDGVQTYDEFVPYCDPAMRTFASMRDTDRKKWFDALKKEIGK